MNREVEIRRGYGLGVGERTDIHVDAIARDSNEGYKKITVIIEVKGCWNDGIDMDMENQLTNRYLRDNLCRHGIYLVGWFYCQQWNPSKMNKSIESVRQHYYLQAQRLSKDNNCNINAYVMDTGLRAKTYQLG